MSQSADPPPPIPPSPPTPPSPPHTPPPRPETPICGAKFHKMLSCVERTGATTACTEKINDFLACERSVFRAAVRKTSHTTAPRPAPYPVHPQKVPRPPRPEPDAAPSPPDLLSSPLAAAERVVKKQIAACDALVETVRKPRYQTQLLEFQRRMLTDMRVTWDVVRAKAGQFVGHLAKGGSENDKPPS